MGVNIAATIVAGFLGAFPGVPAFGGGVLLCNEFGCRSSPYFPPIPIPTPPPVIYNPAPHGGPARAYPPVVVPRAIVPIPPPTVWPQRQPDLTPSPPHVGRRSDPPPPPRERADPEGKAIERDITAFCEAHPDEGFCQRLDAFLRKHPEARPRD